MGLFDALEGRSVPGIVAPRTSSMPKLPPGVQPIAPPKVPNITKGVKLPLMERIMDKLLPRNPALAGILSEEDVSAQRKNALIQAGLAMMAQSGPTTGVSPNLGQVVAGGMQAGMGAYQQGTQQQAMMNAQKQQAEAAQQRQEELARARQGMVLDPNMPEAQRYAKLQELMMRAAQMGDVETMRSLAMVLQTTKPDAQTAAKAQEVDLGDRVLLRFPDGTERVIPKGAAPGGAGGGNGLTPYQQMMTDQRQFQREDAIDKQYQGAVETERGLYRKLDTALSRAGEAKAGDGAAQVEMLYAFISALDPASAVREGEIGLAREASTLRAKAEMMVRKYQGGQSVVVGPELVAQMERFMKRRRAMAAGAINSKREHYVGRAKRAGINDPEGLLGEQVVDFGDVVSNGVPAGQARIKRKP